ncbi:thiamine-phosphate kinase [Candidatus Thiothrix sp. Deng01]|uniref:Thiamine-monophosphate kinase n=1 Tax=Candidatus Thiothrix phosphatis TaxID=3112415 RepID=A0ABU6CTX7_9GAMM|nr:thiamine-phosphate kinase [Candidatus Thiothrix sp. Deng01]MEB4590295.1 thiamine-phosphate kinase [Candidatus Thiothrix sp. Deng01]
MSEFDLIREHFFWRNIPDSVRISVGDDAAVLRMSPGRELAVSVDTFNAGIHFPLDTPPHAVGYKALAVNLSDLAAMGAEPAWFTLALSMPSADREWVREFTQGMQELAEQHNIFLIGGDTTRGPLSITIQVMGWAEPGRALLRSGAQDGDLVCVSGTLGDAAAGLAVVQQRLQLSAEAAEFCIRRLNYPSPRLQLAEYLRGRATACMDISDGLLADLGHILQASGVGAHLYHALVPLSPALGQLTLVQRLDFALRGGDDYELLFTLPELHLSEVQDFAQRLGNRVTVLGEIDADQAGLSVDYAFHDKRSGYEHFS